MAGPLGATLLWEGEGEIQADLWFVHGLRGDPLKTWTKGMVVGRRVRGNPGLSYNRQHLLAERSSEK